MEHVDSAVTSVLSTSRLFMKHPGAMKLAEFYPNATHATTQIAEAVSSNGRLRITSNNLALGASSNFSISSSSLVYGLQLVATITPGANNGFQHDGWLFQAIQSIEVTVSNSLISNMVLTGTAMREYILACCESPEDRFQVLQTAGRAGSIATQQTASIPLGWLIGSGTGLKKDYPIDMSVLNGPIMIQINFNTSNAFITGTSTGAAAPANTAAVAAWDSLFITCATTDLLDGAFAVRTTLMRLPNSSYNIPGKYLNAVRYVETCTINVEKTLNLNSAPAGMLESIILCIKPQVELSSAVGAAGTYIYPGSVELSTLRLQYGGQDLFRASSASEIAQHLRSHFNGDDKMTVWKYLGPSIVAAGTVTNAGADVVSRDAVFRAYCNSNVAIIPLGYDMSSVMSGRHIENLPSYSGANLQLSFTPQRRSRMSTTSGFADISLDDTVGGGVGAQAYLIEVLYVMSSILEISNSTVDLQL